MKSPSKTWRWNDFTLIFTQNLTDLMEKNPIKLISDARHSLYRSCQTIPSNQNFEKLKDGRDLCNGNFQSNCFLKITRWPPRCSSRGCVTAEMAQFTILHRSFLANRPNSAVARLAGPAGCETASALTPTSRGGWW